eukprot:symbB.v1.2.034764.t2/scaffold4548.1/size38217/1
MNEEDKLPVPSRQVRSSVRVLEELPFYAAAQPRKKAAKKAGAAWIDDLEEDDVRRIVQDLPADAASRRRQKKKKVQQSEAADLATFFEASLRAHEQMQRRLDSLSECAERRHERLSFLTEEVRGVLLQLGTTAVHETSQTTLHQKRRSSAQGPKSLAAEHEEIAGLAVLSRGDSESRSLSPIPAGLDSPSSPSHSPSAPAFAPLLFWSTCFREGLRRVCKRQSSADASGGLPKLAFEETFSTQLTGGQRVEHGRQRSVSFVAYFPEVFRDLRLHAFGVSEEIFMHSMCDGPLSGGQQGEGKSGMLFFSSWDKKYLIKTVMQKEVAFFVDHLVNYHNTAMSAFLEAERARASFAVRELTYFLDGGQKRTLQREKIETLVESDPVFANSDLYNLTRPERHQRAMQKQRRLLQLSKDHGYSVPELRAAVHDMLGTDLQSLMFIPNIRATFSDEQQAIWLPRAEGWEIIGCYAQTELGHGSNVRALETTATFIPDTDEIEIHSPSLTSTKWWPGAMGRTANYAIVYARLIVQGRDLGIHNFMVQIRDLQTHKPMMGVEVGDIGPKIGYNNQDNGFCRFHHVRIPRSHMAMRHVTLHPDGRYEAVEGRRTASYSAMTSVRVEIVLITGSVLSMACTIAIRYSAVRRQGFTSKDDGSEMCILDYTMQQERLLPLLATAYAFHCAAATMRAILASGDAATLHVASSGLKALCSRIAGDGIETCRRACGGHGYLAVSGLPELLGTYLQNVTVEGENYMIAQQTTRGLLKLLSSSPSSVFVNAWEGEHSGYLHSTMASARCEAKTSKDFLSMELQCAAYCQRAAWLLSHLQQRLQHAQAGGATAVDAWNSCCPDVIRVSEAHCFYVLVRSFWRSIQQLGKSPIAAVLENCCHLFALWWMRENLGDFLESGFLTVQQAGLLRDEVNNLFPVLRPDAVSLVDAWGHSDHCLNSALGRRDGRVYEALWESAQPKTNPMNKEEVSPAFHESLLPMRASKL